MSKSGIISAAVLALCACAAAVARADEVAAMLQRADALRLPDAQARVEMRVRLYNEEQLDKEKGYTVYTRPGRRSLVLFRAPGEAGQKVLMLDDAYWMFLPGTRRPIRITPMQKLLGEASTGDVATLTWSEDYGGRMVEARYRGEPCSGLCSLVELTSRREGTTYQRIELWLDPDAVPIHAKLYLVSGKLAKEARYTVGELEGRRRVTAMTLFDRIAKDRRTEIEYLKVKAVAAPDKFFNPAFLARDNLEGW